MTENIIGFSLSENTEKEVKTYDKSIEIRQKELENQLNNLR